MSVGEQALNNIYGLGGGTGAIIGVFRGCMYQPTSAGGCMKDVSGVLSVSDSVGFLSTKLYYPWYWSETMLNLQDGT